MTKAEIVLPANDLHAELAFFTERLGFRLEQIFPAEDPIVAVVSGHRLRLRLARNAETAPVLLRVVSDNPDERQQKLTSPAGNRVEIHDAREPSREVAMQPSFQIHRLAGGEDWIIGRAACTIAI